MPWEQKPDDEEDTDPFQAPLAERARLAYLVAVALTFFHPLTAPLCVGLWLAIASMLGYYPF